MNNRRNRHWTDLELARLRQLYRMGYCAKQMEPDIGRTRACIVVKARELGYSLPHKPCNAPLPPPMQLTSAVEQMSEWASVPRKLAQIVVDEASERNIPLRLLRSDKRHQVLVDCRRSIALKALQNNFKYSQIGRALNRDHTTIMYHVQCAA